MKIYNLLSKFCNYATHMLKALFLALINPVTSRLMFPDFGGHVCICLCFQFNYSSGQPAPESITDKIYGNTLSVSIYSICVLLFFEFIFL